MEIFDYFASLTQGEIDNLRAAAAEVLEAEELTEALEILRPALEAIAGTGYIERRAGVNVIRTRLH